VNQAQKAFIYLAYSKIF